LNPITAGDNTIFGTESFPQDAFNEIISCSKQSLVALSCINKQFNKLTNDYAKNNLPESCFGEKEWKKYGADIGILPAISLKIIQDFDGSKFILTLIPETLNGEPLTLTSIDEFIKSLKKNDESNYFFSLLKSGISNETAGKHEAHYMMLSKDVLGGEGLVNGTRNKSFKIQEKLVKEKGFEIPNLRDVVVSLFMHNINKREVFLYPDESNSGRVTYTRVQEQNNQGYRIIVYGFFALALNLGHGYDDDNLWIGTAYSGKSGH